MRLHPTKLLRRQACTEMRAKGRAFTVSYKVRSKFKRKKKKKTK